MASIEGAGVSLSKTRLIECGAVGGVPVVVAVGPGQHGREGGKDVVQGPGQDDVVLTVEQEDDHSRGVPDTCGTTQSGDNI